MIFNIFTDGRRVDDCGQANEITGRTIKAVGRYGTEIGFNRPHCPKNALMPLCQAKFSISSLMAKDDIPFFTLA